MDQRKAALMKEIYLQLNVFLALSWLIFQFLPLKNWKYRSRVLIGRTLLLSSLFFVCIITLLPNRLFPHWHSPIVIQQGLDVDASLTPPPPTNPTNTTTAFVKAKDLVDFDKITFSALWPWLLLLGMMVILLYKITSWLQLRQILTNGVPLHSIGFTSVVLSESLAVPISVLQSRRAYIVLPTWMIPYRQEFHIALKHEIEHHRQGDTRWAFILELLTTLFYLNPFSYLWKSNLISLQELACDESLISQMRVSKQDYGSCLLKVAEMALSCRHQYVGTTFMASTSELKDHSFLLRRIKMFKQHEIAKWKKKKITLIGTLLMATLAGGAFIANAALRSTTQPNPGQPVFDNQVQALVKESLTKGLNQFKASAGFAIVANPRTGVVLASVNINRDFDSYLKGQWALSYPMQPASAIKPLLLATALQKGATQIQDSHNCENGRYTFGENTFYDHKAFNTLTSAEAIIQSSNICTLKVGQKLGATYLEQGLRDFGLGVKGSVKDFPAARVGYVPSANVTSPENYLGYLAHGVSEKTGFYITPLELVQAYSVFANGGKLMKAIDFSGSQSTQILRQVLSTENARTINNTLIEVVSKGTARSIKDPQLEIAGKTATLDIEGNHRVTGFIGYAPANHPQLVVYVTLFDPKGAKRVGSNTAAPIFKEIIKKTLPRL